MRSFLLTLLATLIIGVANVNAQVTLSGSVRDTDTSNPLLGVSVKVVGSNISATTDKNGEYTLTVPAGKYVFVFVSQGYQSFELEFEVSEAGKLPDVSIRRAQVDEGQSLSLSEVTISTDDLESEGSNQAVAGLLQSTQDAFNNAVSYTFSSARFQVRGYDSDYSLLYMNGIPVNDPESGFAGWSSWGGLNDVTRNKESVNGLSPTEFSFGGLGGATNINSRASLQRKGTRVSYASTNRTYTNRLMFTHSTGLMENGTAFTISGSRRWAEEGYVEGTNYDGWAYFVGIEKKFNSRHSVAFTTFNAPTKRGMQGVATDEANDLAGTNYYNPNWGYQNGEKRNAKVRFQQEPTFIFNHFWNVNEDLKLTSTLGYTFGTYQTTALNWYDAQDPRPDYYRKLPSYWDTSDPSVVEEITNAFRTDASVRQLDWDYMYQTNYNSVDTSGLLRSKYILENRITDSRQLSFSSVANWSIMPNLKLNGGIEASMYKGRNYKEISDLLGADFWLDVDQFIERDTYIGSGESQNDVDNPNRMVKEGDVFGYDYTANVNNAGLWAVANYVQNRFEYYFGANATYTEFWRTGDMKNGRFPNDSKGDSKKQRFDNYGVKGGATWKISGRNYLDANVAYLTRAPFFRNSFISPRTSNFVIPELTSEKIASADLNYNLRTPYIKARISAYYTMFMDQTEQKSFYLESENSFVNYTMKGIDKVHKGLEIGAEYKLTPAITLNAAAALGTYQYTSRPNVTITKDNFGTVVAANRTIYIKNFYIPSTPQTAAMFGFRYASPKYWFLGASVSYYDDIYIDFAPERRTAEVLAGLEPDDPAREAITKQSNVPSAFLVDANIGKSWRINNYYINLNFQVANVLDNTEFQTGGYEQLRYTVSNEVANKFPPRYFYAYGRTYYLILGLRF
ncbi:MAG TPA: TonB-dependent receptor [Tenuifilaceae bacterium]|nr:TonB-dependent receptor [Tenuifilaceae bacterium]